MRVSPTFAVPEIERDVIVGAIVAIALVAFEVALFEPIELLTVMNTFIYFPTSVEVRTYVELVAPEISENVELSELDFHW